MGIYLNKASESFYICSLTDAHIHTSSGILLGNNLIICKVIMTLSEKL